MCSFLTLTVGVFVGVCGPMHCAHPLLCLCPCLGGFAEGQCPCSAHTVFLQLSLEKQPHTLGQRCHKLAHSASKVVKANFTTFNPTWFHIGFFKIQDQRWPAHPFKSESQSSVSHLTRILSRYMIICSIRSNLMFLSVSRKCTKMLRSWKYFTGSAATPVFLQP